MPWLAVGVALNGLMTASISSKERRARIGGAQGRPAAGGVDPELLQDRALLPAR